MHPPVPEVVVAFLEDLDAVVAEVDDDDVALGRDADAARAVKLTGPGPLAPERADEDASRGKYLKQLIDLNWMAEFVVAERWCCVSLSSVNEFPEAKSTKTSIVSKCNLANLKNHCPTNGLPARLQVS